MNRRYEWPRVTVLHPDRGAYQVDVHCLRSPKNGDMVLIAFFGVPSTEQVRIVRATAAGMGDEVVPLTEDDISEDMALRLAAEFNAHPDGDVCLVPVRRP